MNDGTIVFSVPEEDLDSTGRVILEAGRWCKTFYADEQPRMKGKWIPKDDGRYYCSSCNDRSPKGYRWDYCPNFTSASLWTSLLQTKLILERRMQDER